MTSVLVGAALALIGFVITQSILKFVIEPIHEQRTVIREVANAIVVYANASIDDSWKEHLEKTKGLDTAMERVAETQVVLRTLSGKLRTTLLSIPLYKFFSRIRLVRGATDITEAFSELIGWSNCLVGREASDRVRQRQDTVIEKLGIEKKYQKLQQ
jgi:hypothetical protein